METQGSETNVQRRERALFIDAGLSAFSRRLAPSRGSIVRFPVLEHTRCLFACHLPPPRPWEARVHVSGPSRSNQWVICSRARLEIFKDGVGLTNGCRAAVDVAQATLAGPACGPQRNVLNEQVSGLASTIALRACC